MTKQDYAQLTLFQEDSPASRSVLPGSEEARKMTVTSGRKCYELYKNSDPLGLLVRMLLGSSIWHSTRCYLTWRVSATPARRLLFRLAPSMPRTGEIDARLWLGTPTAGTGSNGRSQKWRKGKTPNPQEFVKMWPTPRANDAEKRGAISLDKRNGLPAAVLFPTPKAQNCRGDGKPHGNGGPSLDVVAGGTLNPDWVEWLMAFPPGWTDIG